MAKRKLGKYKCTHCDRVFAMPAHLARHMNSVHRPGGAKVKRGRPAKATVAARGGFSMPAIAMPDASHLLSQMQSYKDQLLSQRAAVEGQIEAIDNALTMFGAAPTVRRGAFKAGDGRRGRRGPREGSLKTYIHKVLQAAGKPMAVKDVANSVLRAGFKTKNKALAKSVGVTLTQMGNVRKVDRGVFTLK